MDGRRSRKGFIAVTALLIMAILLMIGVAFLSMATTENTMVVNEINGQVAFNIAEAGIDHAKRVLQTCNLTSVLGNNGRLSSSFCSNSSLFNNTLNNNSGSLAVGGSSGTYTVVVTNNTTAINGIPADTGGAMTDIDGRVVIDSTGTYRNAAKVVQALIEIPAILNPPSSIYTLNGPDADEPTDFTFNGNSFGVDGNDHNAGDTNPIPPDPQKPPVPGLGVMACSTCDPDDTPLQEANDALGPQEADNIIGAGANPSIAVATTSITASYLTTFKSDLTAHAGVTYNGNTTIDSSTLGTQANPQITVVNGDLKLKGSASGFGIVLVTGEFEMGGNATFQGIILVDGKGEVELKGSAKIWGAVIHINRGPGSDDKTELEIAGNAQVYYSRQAITDYGGGSVSSTTLAWSERSPS